ncbi:MAG: ribokinase [Phenylobacterium sp.]
MNPPSVLVVGSVNLDLVASAPSLPRPGETVIGARLQRHPGGKGANQALALARLGAQARLWARTGDDAFADEALVLLAQAGVDLSGVVRLPGETTGVALIGVDPAGENQILVASGANAAPTPDDLPEQIPEALLCQLELPVPVVAAAVRRAQGFVALNLAPFAPLPADCLERADLVVVNALEAEALGAASTGIRGALAVTLGAEGARLYRRGRLTAEARPPGVRVVDATGAGDVFTAALTLALLEGREDKPALDFACAAAALSTTRPGAQPACPHHKEVEALLSGDRS